MGWHWWYTFRSYVRSSLWAVPFIALLLQQATLHAAIALEQKIKWIPAWPLSPAGTEAALQAMGIGMNEVAAGSETSEHASASLRNIFGVVKESSQLIEEISASSEEQARVTRNLAHAMQTISNITHETSAAAHQTAATLQAMVNVSEQLNEAVSRFKVD